jgi:hypothetical protein
VWKRYLLALAVVLLACSGRSLAQQQQTLCTNVASPAGWVTIHITTSSAFGCPNIPNNVKVIEKIDTMVTNTVLAACNDGTALPSGWVVTDFSTTAADCGDINFNIEQIRNLNGNPIGTQVQVCNQSGPIPTGWNIIGVSTDFARCSRTNQDILLIRRDTGPDLSLSLSPTSQSVIQGAATSVSANLVRSGGLTDPANMSVSGPLPGGVGVTFSPNPVTGTSSTVTVTTSTSTPVGSFGISITAIAGVYIRTAILTLNVQPSGNFALSTNPNPQVLVPGTSNSIDVSIVRTPGFGSAVNLSASGLPAGVTASFSPGSTTGNLSTLTLTATSSVALGQFTFTITGTSGSTVNSASSTVTATLVPAWWEAVRDLITQ